MSSNGYITDYKLYSENICDINTLKDAVANHAKVFGKDFTGASADRAYYDADLNITLE
jgi:hypothetical protein